MSAYLGAVSIQDKHGRPVQAFAVAVSVEVRDHGSHYSRLGWVTLTARTADEAGERVRRRGFRIVDRPWRLDNSPAVYPAAEAPM